MCMSVRNQRLPGTERGAALTIQVDGQQVEAYAGESVAAVLLANGRRRFRHTGKVCRPRGIFCGIGVCYDCLVTIDGVPGVRACVTPVSPGMIEESGGGE
jgi:predicted molibdopterin-dependent oxidoreductase YjgC